MRNFVLISSLFVCLLVVNSVLAGEDDDKSKDQQNNPSLVDIIKDPVGVAKDQTKTKLKEIANEAIDQGIEKVANQPGGKLMKPLVRQLSEPIKSVVNKQIDKNIEQLGEPSTEEKKQAEEEEKKRLADEMAARARDIAAEKEKNKANKSKDRRKRSLGERKEKKGILSLLGRKRREKKLLDSLEHEYPYERRHHYGRELEDGILDEAEYDLGHGYNHGHDGRHSSLYGGKRHRHPYDRKRVHYPAYNRERDHHYHPGAEFLREELDEAGEHLEHELGHDRHHGRRHHRLGEVSGHRLGREFDHDRHHGLRRHHLDGAYEPSRYLDGRYRDDLRRDHYGLDHQGLDHHGFDYHEGDRHKHGRYNGYDHVGHYPKHKSGTGTGTATAVASASASAK